MQGGVQVELMGQVSMVDAETPAQGRSPLAYTGSALNVDLARNGDVQILASRPGEVVIACIGQVYHLYICQ
jgi:hypothetical protein